MKLGDRLRSTFSGDKRWPALVAFIVVVAIATALPFGLDTYWQSILIEVLLFALLALGLNVVVGFAGLLDLGYVAFYAIGNYAFAIIAAGDYSKALLIPNNPRLPPLPVWHDWMWLLLIVGLIAAMVTGVILGGPTLRLRGDYLAIVTLGFGEIVRLTARNLDSITVGPRGITPIPHPQINAFGLHYDFGLTPKPYYFVLLILTLLMIGVILRLNDSKIGRAWAAIREDEVAAAAMGVPTVRMKLWAFAIGASTAGVAGVIQAARVTYVSPDPFLLLVSIFILCMVVLGGMGSVFGSIVGAAVVVVIPELLRSQVPWFEQHQEYRFLVFGAVLILMMIYRPQGIIPSRRRAVELKVGVKDATLYEVQAAQSQSGGSDVTS